ncbi:MAG TPA: hypothetical protein VFI23_12285 [Rhizomicrobium sp.]|nr:hypothetical protein [Rhizomicrobium sp.]
MSRKQDLTAAAIQAAAYGTGHLAPMESDGLKAMVAPDGNGQERDRDAPLPEPALRGGGTPIPV